ncbi:FHA domain-containing protein [Arthrobacter crystallopoietes BAB-32]|uniref:FHA domain-containing protein n=1 Tax=Arthrobacter crystallopoietes BAB-32 TaxID=1246476 RepID=N1V2X5_9MICC|nr:FHA domain-containing protein [Arthrobacter crystallopoietes]EMY34334.1 FHA domain-containing protein [Arthrobacter crystallopoietes BAB-32]
MAAVSYRPGPWLGLVRGGTIVLLDSGARDEVVHELWDVLAGQPTLQSVLGAVINAYGSDLSALPEFAIVSFSGQLHTILRGDVVVNADGNAGAAELSGKGVTTWAERLLPEQELFDVVINEGKEGQCRWLPLSEGVVQLGGIRVGNDDGAGTVGAERAVVSPAGAPMVAAPVSASIVSAAEPSSQAPAAEVDPAGPSDRPGEARQQDSGRGPATPDVPEALEQTGVYDLDGLDAPATADTILSPGDEDAEAPTGAGEEDLEETVVHTKAQRANLPANTVPETAEPNPVTPTPAVASGMPARTVPQPPAPETPAVSLIDSVPWLTPSASARARAAESKAAEAAQHVPSPTAGPMLPAPKGDHDGQTLMRSDLKDLAASPPAGAAAAEPPATGPMVLARVCPQGHANPPTRASCSSCAAPLAHDAREVKRPSLGKMRLSSGEVIELDRPVIVGRQPSASRVQGSVMPQLVQVRSVSGDISRSHLEVRLEGWHVILGDLKATNGTMLIRDGQPPRRLGQGESMILFDGDIADLGDGVSLRFEDLL